jgi:hypothetical protein
MNTITINWSAEDRARIDKLIALLEDMPKHDCSKCVDAAAKYAAKLTTVAAAAPVEETQPTEDTTEPEQPAEAPQEAAVEVQEEAPAAPAVDRADIQKKVVALSSAGKKDEVRAIVLAYGNTKVSDIPEDKLGEVFEKLTALEG